MRAAYELSMEDAIYPHVRDMLKDAVWANHRLYLMWCDDNPNFGARDALNIVEGLLP